MARSMPSFGIFSARAAMMAARSRAFIDGSGSPSLAETVISRASLLKSLDLALSCRPLRCMMFLNWECPAMLVVRRVLARRAHNALARVAIPCALNEALKCFDAGALYDSGVQK